MSVPAAEVVAVHARTVTILCPYCHRPHNHAVTVLGAREHRAPGCGLSRSGEDRASGYWFVTNTPHPNQTPQETR